MVTSHDVEFVRAFIVADKQARYLEKLSSPKKRGPFLDRLNHQLDYQPERATLVPRGQQSDTNIEALLKSRGAPPKCWVISSWHEWDARETLLREALSAVVGSGMGTVLSCVAGRLAYYEAEDAAHRYILEAPAMPPNNTLKRMGAE